MNTITKKSLIISFPRKYEVMFFMLITLSVYPHRAGWKVSLTTVGIKPLTFGTLMFSGMTHFGTKYSTFDTNVFYDHDIFCVCFDVMYSGKYNVLMSGVYILQWTLILPPPLLFRFDSFPHIFTTSASKACT
jgi:hypothetical protein